MLAADSPAQTDGRRRRSQQSRDRIIAAMMALIEEGQITPIAEQVADRAHVGLRSVFRHFNDMDSLFTEMALRLARQYQPALAPFLSSDWRVQLTESIDRRVAIYETMLPYKRAADTHRHRSPVLQSSYAATSQLMRARLHSMLPPALKGDQIALETLDLVLSIDSWQRLRLEQKLSVAAARTVVERQVHTLVSSEDG